MQSNHHFIKQLNRKNLCTWYILPLVGMNLHSFGEANIVNTFLVTGKMLIAVEVLDSNLCPDMRHHFAYQQTLTRVDHELMVFEIPDRYKRVCITPVGVPRSWPEKSKKSLEELVVFEAFK